MPSKIFRTGKKGTFQYHGYFQGREYRESLHTTSKRNAEREQRARDAKYDDPNHIAPKRVNAKLDDFWKAYTTAMKPPRRTESTIERQTTIWEQFKDFTKAERLGDVGKKEMEAFARSLIDKGKAPATANKALITLQVLYGFAIREGYFSGENPVKGIERFPEPKHVPDYWSKEEAEKILKAAKKKELFLYHVCLLGIRAGMRKSEIIACRRDWFDFDHRLIRIKEQRTGRQFRIKDLDERVIDMHEDIHAGLKDFEGDYIVPILRKGKGKEGRYRTDPHRSLEALLRGLKLSDEDPFNRLRRTFGSLLVLEGVPIIEVSQQMGHSSVTTTERHYIGLIRSRRRH